MRRTVAYQTDSGCQSIWAAIKHSIQFETRVCWLLDARSVVISFGHYFLQKSNYISSKTLDWNKHHFLFPLEREKTKTETQFSGRQVEQVENGP